MDADSDVLSDLADRPEDAVSRIGPNALIQTVQAMREVLGDAPARALLRQSDHAGLLDHDPTAMVPEQEFVDLVAFLAARLPSEQVCGILWRSGELTAGYLLAHRIPGVMQRLLPLLPPRGGLTILLAAISKHAWTFVGSGDFRYKISSHPRMTISTCIPVAESAYAFYGGTFDRLLKVLIRPQTVVTPSVKPTQGGFECVYDVDFHPGHVVQSLETGAPAGSTKTV